MQFKANMLPSNANIQTIFLLSRSQCPLFLLILSMKNKNGTRKDCNPNGKTKAAILKNLIVEEQLK